MIERVDRNISNAQGQLREAQEALAVLQTQVTVNGGLTSDTRKRN